MPDSTATRPGPTSAIDPDVLRFDLDAVDRLRSAAVHAGTDLLADHRALVGLLTEASALTGRDEALVLVHLGSLRRDLDEVAADVTVRVLKLAATMAGAAELDALTARINGWVGSPNSRRLLGLQREQRRLVEGLGVGADGVDAVVAQLTRGTPVVDAVLSIAQRQREASIAEVMAAKDLSRGAAITHIEALQLDVDRLIASGTDPTAAIAAVSIANRLEIDLDEARTRADATGIGVIDAIGQLSLAAALGLPIDDVVTLDALRNHFAELDNATGGLPDRRVSVADLRYVSDHPERFAPAQVSAATAVLASPTLLRRFDTASTDGVLSASGDHATSDPDGLISVDDLGAFVVKGQITHALGAYAPLLDVASDPGGRPDGFVSKADLEAFLADTPQLPAEVLTAATAMIESGIYDETWLETHRDELVTAAAVAAGATAAAIVITASGGTAAPIVVTGMGAIAGATASGVTTVSLNATDDGHDLLDDVLGNTLSGALLGGTTAALPLSFRAAAAAPSLTTRIIAAADMVSDAASITSAGGIDMVLPESVEQDVHEGAELVAAVAGPVAAYRD